MKAGIPVYSARRLRRPDTFEGAGARGAVLDPPRYGIDLVDRPDSGALHRAARLGLSGPAGPVPHLPALRRAFGRHDISGVSAHGDGRAATGAAALGTVAYAHGEHVAFAGQPSLRVVAHEAAHVVQQRAGVRLPEGLGRADDAHERMADAVAERVVAGRSAEDLLDRAGPPARPRAGSAEGQAVQCYSVLGADHLYAAMPKKRPWFGYPYAVANSADFVAQQPRNGVDGVDEFLDSKGSKQAWTAGAGNNLALRLSNDTNMAIEDTDLAGRQPKVFFATQGVVDASNNALKTAGSAFRLQTDGNKTVTVLTGWWSQTKLLQVSPQYNGGSADQAPQNCNAIAAKVIGSEANALNLKGRKAMDMAKRLAPRAAKALADVWDDLKVDVAPYEEDVVKEYALTGARDEKGLAREGVNRHAAPAVGETYMIANLGRGQDQGNGTAKLHDYASDSDRVVSWPYHFGGVVAESGGDRVTLENFARGDDRQSGADPRWYFQMYGQAKGQSFHEQYSATNTYANALTVAVKKTD